MCTSRRGSEQQVEDRTRQQDRTDRVREGTVLTSQKAGTKNKYTNGDGRGKRVSGQREKLCGWEAGSLVKGREDPPLIPPVVAPATWVQPCRSQNPTTHRLPAANSPRPLGATHDHSQNQTPMLPYLQSANHRIRNQSDSPRETSSSFVQSRSCPLRVACLRPGREPTPADSV